MALSPIDAVCTKCRSGFNQIPKQSFLGFQKLTCPTCQEKITYPLTSGYRTTYWVIFGLMALMIINAFSQGGFGFPGGFGLAVTFALLRDGSIRKRIYKATNSASLEGTRQVINESHSAMATGERSMTFQKPTVTAALPTYATSMRNMPSPTVQNNHPSTSQAVTMNEINEEKIYEEVAHEVESGNVRKGLWTKLWTELGGNDSKVKLAYIKARVAHITAEQQEAIRLAAEIRVQQEIENERLRELAASNAKRNSLMEIETLLSRPKAAKTFDEEIRLFELMGGKFKWLDVRFSEKCLAEYLDQSYDFSDGRLFSSWMADHVVPMAKHLLAKQPS